MANQKHPLAIAHIQIGFAQVVTDSNYADSHQALKPFGMKWGRGMLVRGSNYLESVTGPYGCSHSALKTDLGEDESSGGSYYYGYVIETRTLYLEYASDRTFDFHDPGVLSAIMESLRHGSGPLMNFTLVREEPRA